jgi:hypothetical protein
MGTWIRTMIQAGNLSQVVWTNGEWIFLDIGFSNKSRTCGLLVGDGQPRSLLFSEAQSEIKKVISDSQSCVNLVIAAPLSVCFNKSGNPKRRKVEYERGKARYWYYGPGCSVIVAAIYLIHEIQKTGSQVPIRLFEGFVSFKDAGKKSRHELDVIRLRKVVQDRSRGSGSIHDAHELKEDPSDKLMSATAIMGLDYGVPAIIKPAL